MGNTDVFPYMYILQKSHGIKMDSQNVFLIRLLQNVVDYVPNISTEIKKSGTYGSTDLGRQSHCPPTESWHMFLKKTKIAGNSIKALYHEMDLTRFTV